MKLYEHLRQRLRNAAQSVKAKKIAPHDTIITLHHTSSTFDLYLASCWAVGEVIFKTTASHAFTPLDNKVQQQNMFISRPLQMWLGLLAVQIVHESLVLAFSTTRLTTFSTSQQQSVSSHTRLFASDEENAPTKNAPGHDVRSDVEGREIDPEEAKIQLFLAEHQQNAPKLGWATDIRTLVAYNHGFAVMSTISKS